MKKTTSNKLSLFPANARSNTPRHAEIAIHAETLWRFKGCPVACDDEIWLEAERQLLARNDERLSFDSDAVMAELDGQFPGSTGMATTSL